MRSGMGEFDVVDHAVRLALERDGRGLDTLCRCLRASWDGWLTGMAS